MKLALTSGPYQLVSVWSTEGVFLLCAIRLSYARLYVSLGLQTQLYAVQAEAFHHIEAKPV